jgi:hypothetical protein
LFFPLPKPLRCSTRTRDWASDAELASMATLR